ncbi:MAG: flagellar basal body P-ring protein FlgI [Polyangiaceae bacterium]
MKHAIQLISAAIVVLALFAPRAAHAEKLRDLCDVSGARENQLVGYGIVTGLTGTGDDVSVPFTAQSVLSLLRRLGLQVNPAQLRLKNVAAVMVTATLPAFAKAGTKIDINVSSIGNARSLLGGVLVQAVLKGADQKTYAVGQGSLLVGGFEAHGASGTSVKSNSVTSARIPEGAIVEREVVANLVTNGTMKLELRTPGFAIASRISEAVNKKLGNNAANALDSGSVLIHVPAEFNNKIVDLIASLEEIDIVPVRRARVVINERTGTIVAGGDVRLSPVAVVHGGLTIVVKETPAVSQPTAPFGKGTTVVVPQTDISTSEGDKNVTYIPPQPNLSDVASALGSLGLSPRELASVLEALRAAGALEAEVVVQ